MTEGDHRGTGSATSASSVGLDALPHLIIASRRSAAGPCFFSQGALCAYHRRSLACSRAVMPLRHHGCRGSYPLIDAVFPGSLPPQAHEKRLLYLLFCFSFCRRDEGVHRIEKDASCHGTTPVRKPGRRPATAKYCSMFACCRQQSHPPRPRRAARRPACTHGWYRSSAVAVFAQAPRW